MPLLKNYFSIITGKDPFFNKKKEIMGYNKYEWVLKEEYEDVVNPEEEMSLILQLQSIEQYGLQIKNDLDAIAPYITLLTSLIYFTAGFYRLYIILI